MNAGRFFQRWHHQFSEIGSFRHNRPRLLFMGTSEEPYCSHNWSCCKCAWNTWHLWMCTPVVPPSDMYHYWCMRFLTVILNITLISDSFNKNLSIPFICHFSCLSLIASLALPYIPIQQKLIAMSCTHSKSLHHEYGITLYVTLVQEMTSVMKFFWM